MRPKFEDYFPDETNLKDIFNMIENLPKPFWNYINDLDGYIDELEEKILCSEKTEQSEVNNT
jgi:hypothetical protein